MKTDDLFVTEIGSAMWGMKHAKSDTDLFHCYTADIIDILEGRRIAETKPTKQEENTDHQFMEIGHLVNLLINGNVSAIWAVCSPVVVVDSPVLRDLREITVGNLSKASFKPIKGIAMSNWQDETRRAGKEHFYPGKGYRQAMRAMTFGISLAYGRVDFALAGDVAKAMDINEGEKLLASAMELLERTYKESPLPDEPNPEPFRKFMYEFRMNQIDEVKNG
jgi:predicted nucleotidyltransferase